MRTPIILATVVVSALTTGCVKKSTHEKAIHALEAKLTDANGRITALEGQVAQLSSGKSTAEQELEKVKGEKASTETELAATAADLAELKEMREADQKRLAAFTDLQDRFKSLVDAGDLEVAFRNGQMTLKLPSGVLFPSAKAELSDGGKKTLTKVAKVLAGMGKRRYLVAGHTDTVPIANDEFKNNWYLSSARAVSVVEFMIEQGMPAEQLAAAGYADKDPVASNKSAKGRQKNRRIEIILVPDLSDLPKLAKGAR